MIQVNKIRQYQKKAFLYVFFLWVALFFAITILTWFSSAQSWMKIIVNNEWWTISSLDNKHGSAKENIADVNLSPLYSSVEDWQWVMFAGCENSVNVDVKSQNIKEVHIEIEYDIEDLSVDKVLLTHPTPKTWYRIESNQIIYTQKSKSGSFLDFDGTVFSFVFQSDVEILETKLIISPESYIISAKWDKIFLSEKTQNLTFSEVWECNPDVIAPFITLISPKDSWNNTYTSVVIKVTDNKAGVDREKLDIILDGLHYKIWDENVQKDNDMITITPVLDFSYWENIELTVIAQDKNLSRSNKTQQIFSFETTTDTPMCQELWCAISLGRQISKKECIQFQKMFLYSDEIWQKSIKKLFEDLQFKCDLDNIEVLREIAEKDDRQLKRVENAKSVGFNLFSLLWWVLFAVSFVLKLRYMKQYRKFKKYRKKYE